MEIIIYEYSGFCEGVERAYKIAVNSAKEKKQLYMLGSLVHNSEVVGKLEESGVKLVNSLEEIPKGQKDASVIISAHGVSPDIFEKAKSLGFNIIDTTCPWVKSAQNIAKKLSDMSDLSIIIVGDKNHPEVKGILGWTKNKGIIVENKGDLKKIGNGQNAGVLSQTTQSSANFDLIVEELKNKFKNLIIHKTICGATGKRQKAAVDTAKKVEVMIVIGDKKSANTKRLKELCEAEGIDTYQIQTASEIDQAWILNKERVGVTAGASTPSWVIDGVIDLLRARK